MSETNKEPKSICPPESVFDRPPMTLEEKVMEGNPIHIFTGKVTVPPEGGMNLWFKEVPYPKKGFPFMQATLANNIVKRQTMMIVSSVAQKRMILPIMGFMLMRYKNKIAMLENFLNHYVRNSDYIMTQFYLKDQFMSPPAKQIQIFITNLLTEIGINPSLALSTARIIATMMEYDDAYRYRIEDMAFETTPDKLYASPAAEIDRILLIYQTREKVMPVVAKFRAFSLALSFLLIYPRVRIAFRKAVRSMDFKYIQLDEADRYHCLLRDDYNFMGRTIDDRIKEYEKIHTVSKCCGYTVGYSPVGEFQGPTVCKKCHLDCDVEIKYPPVVVYQPNNEAK